MKINLFFRTEIKILFFLLFSLIFYKGQTTVVYTYTGNTQTFTVPTGVTSITVKSWGAGGGGAYRYGGSGGSGAYVKADLPVTPGAVLNILVGGAGTSDYYNIHNGGYGGGGTAGEAAGSGGGFSALYVGTTLAATNIRVLAGGGGGGGYFDYTTYGGAGGATDAGDINNNITGGKAAVMGGGAPGSNANNNTNGATAGSQLQGGKGSTTKINGDAYLWGGGGGGGGYFGGGGGFGTSNNNNYNSTGGGGGSNYTNVSATSVVTIAGNTTTNGNSPFAPNNSDANYIPGVGRGGADGGNGGNGLIVITYSQPACSGVPTAGTSNLTPNTGSASSSFVGAVSGSSNGTGLSYQWQISSVGGTNIANWADILGQTGATANLIAENLPPGSVMYYRRAITCDTTGDKRYSTQSPFTISSPSYCIPSSTTANNYYITNVKFLGTLNDTDNPSGFSNSPRGYQDFTNLPDRAVQEQGAGINISVKNTLESVTKAWVDWNQNGIYENNELVYNTGTTSVGFTIFGFTVPINQLPGYYRIRIRIAQGSGFNPCDNTTNGEAEDYLFHVIPSCSAAISSVTSVPVCGTGKKVTFNFSTVNATRVRIYSLETDTVPFADISSSAPFTTPVINTTTTYYATALTAANGCESKKKIKITAVVNPTAEISFDNTITDFCGDNSGGQSLSFSASGDKETVELINENFDAGLGVFENKIFGDSNSKAFWQKRESIYIPNSDYIVLKPALASGLALDGFALVNTDMGSGTNRVNALTSTGSFDTQNFINLKLDFNMYAFFEGIKPAIEYFSVEISQNNGGSWTEVKKYTTNIGIPNKWVEESLDLTAYKNTPNLKLRFVISAFGGTNQWSGDIAGVDAIRLYGEKPLNATFTWAVLGGDPIIFNSDCTTPYNGQTATICIQPPANLLLTRYSWTVTAKATLGNGCSATGTLTINNNTRTWIPGSNGNWSSVGAWKPNSLPDETKCVLVPGTAAKTLTVDISDAKAKTVKIENGGSIIIKADNALTVTSSIINNGNGDNFLVENDANLIQIDDASNNTGNIKLQRNSKMKRLEYIYWGTPVEGQILRTFSPKTVASRFYSYNEIDDTFSIITTLNNPMVKGQGYVIRAPNDFTTDLQSWTGIFTGKPTNGIVNVAVTKSGAGKNLVGNPYPSNISLDQLTADNPVTSNGVYYFWTNINDFSNTGNTTPNGSNGNYNDNNYASYNGLGGTPAANSSIIPSGIIKPGQGFLYEAKAGGTLKFTNNVRTKEVVDQWNINSTFISNKTGGEPTPPSAERYWLKLTNPAGNFNTVLLGYIEGAKNSYESRFDAKFPVASSDRFYSVSDGNDLIIQGRQYPFVDTDVVPLGMTAFETGTYTISLSEKEGIFENGQNIYLKDKQTGIVTNLSEGSYSYTAEAGESTNRFLIVYQRGSVLTTSGSAQSKVEVFRDAADFVVRSAEKEIAKVDVYDAAGRLVISLTGKSNQIRFNAERLIDGMYILTAQLKGGERYTKKIRK